MLGQYAGKLPNVGTFFNFLKTTTGYIVCILVPFILVILYQGVNTVVLFKKYKKEQMADLVAEREQIEKEMEICPETGVIPTFIFLCGSASGDNVPSDVAQDTGMGNPIVQS